MANNLLQPEEIFFTNFEPKLKHRFILYVDGIPSFLVKRVALPKFNSEVVEIPHMNVYHYVKGKTTWQEVEMELYDPIIPSGAEKVMEWFRLSHESVTGRDGYADFYKKDVTINIIGPPGNKVGEWVLKGAWPMSGDFSEMDWANNNEYVSINVTLRYDFAIYNF